MKNQRKFKKSTHTPPTHAHLPVKVLQVVHDQLSLHGHVAFDAAWPREVQAVGHRCVIHHIFGEFAEFHQDAAVAGVVCDF